MSWDVKNEKTNRLMILPIGDKFIKNQNIV